MPELTAIEDALMLPRTLEPEVMESEQEARDYDTMDHSVVNETFVNDFVAALRQAGFEDRLNDANQPLSLLDCGTGTALIPIVLAKRAAGVVMTAVDLSDEMLKRARRNVETAGLRRRITLQAVDCKQLPFHDDAFDAVMSNSIVHHVPTPAQALCEMVRVVRRDGLLFVRDLMRPQSARRLDELVEKHAGGENDRQKRLFRDSLHAALNLDEVRQALSEIGLDPCMVDQTSDRHWTIAGIPKRS